MTPSLEVRQQMVLDGERRNTIKVMGSITFPVLIRAAICISTIVLHQVAMTFIKVLHSLPVLNRYEVLGMVSTGSVTTLSHFNNL